MSVLNPENKATEAPPCSVNEAMSALKAINSRFGLPGAVEALARLGCRKMSGVPDWGYAELVRFNRMEASNINEFSTQPWSEATDFLERLRPGGPWVLVAIPEAAPVVGQTVSTADEVRSFLRTYNGKRNLYYSVNPTRRPTNKKSSKADIARVEYVLGDLDPLTNEPAEAAKHRYLVELQRDDFELKPTVVVDSGNGIQVLWRLKDPIILGKPTWSAAGGKLSLAQEDEAKIADAENQRWRS